MSFLQRLISNWITITLKKEVNCTSIHSQVIKFWNVWRLIVNGWKNTFHHLPGQGQKFWKAGELEQWMGLQFSGSLNHTGKTTGNKRLISSKHYSNLMLPTYFASWWHRVFWQSDRFNLILLSSSYCADHRWIQLPS